MRDRRFRPTTPIALEDLHTGGDARDWQVFVGESGVVHRRDVVAVEGVGIGRSTSNLGSNLVVTLSSGEKVWLGHAHDSQATSFMRWWRSPRPLSGRGGRVSLGGLALGLFAATLVAVAVLEPDEEQSTR